MSLLFMLTDQKIQFPLNQDKHALGIGRRVSRGRKSNSHRQRNREYEFCAALCDHALKARHYQSEFEAETKKGRMEHKFS